MQRRDYLRWSLGLAGLALGGMPVAAVAVPAQALAWRERALLGFGTTLWLRVAHERADHAEAALDAAVAEIRRVERLMSLFDPDSALCQLNRTGRLRRPDPQLRDLLRLARRVSQHSGGAFDITMQPYWQIWSRASQDGGLPSARVLEQARRLVDWRAVRATEAELSLPVSGMSLSLNGIAQGWAADRVRAVLAGFGIRHAMIDCGETAVLGHAPSGGPWAFGIEDAVVPEPDARRPMPTLIADGRAIATSSDRHTAFSADRRHHHIMDPHTGYSPTHWSSVTVIAPACALADALTKVFFMLPPSKVMTAARAWQVDVVLEDKAGRWIASPGAPLLADRASPAVSDALRG